MKVDHNSLFSLNTIGGLFYPWSGVIYVDAPSKPLVKLSKAWSIPRPDSSASLVDNVYAAACLHEELHYIQAVSTTAGIFESMIESAKIHVLVLFCEQLHRLGVESIPIPLGKYDVMHLLPKTAYDAFEEYMGRLTVLRRIQDCFSTGVDDKWPLLKRYLGIFLDTTEPFCLPFSVADLSLSDVYVNSKGDFGLCPIGVSGATGDLYFLGSNHIYESWAMAIELLVLHFAVSESDFEELLSERYYGAYALVHGMIRHYCPKLLKDGYQASLLTTAAICELALMPPLLSINDEKFSWMDFQPAQRLSSIIESIKSFRIPSLSFRDIDTDLQRFVRDICAACKWPSPLDESSQWLFGVNRSRQCTLDNHFENVFSLYQTAADSRLECPPRTAFHPVFMVEGYSFDPLSIKPDIIFSCEGPLFLKSSSVVKNALHRHIIGAYARLLNDIEAPLESRHLIETVLPVAPHEEVNIEIGLISGLENLLNDFYSGYGPTRLVAAYDKLPKI